MEEKKQPETEVVEEVIVDDVKTTEELEAEAKALEEENKKLKAEREDKERHYNQMRRLEKARIKNEELKAKNPVKPVQKDVDVRDLLTLSKFDIQETSDKAKILQKYKDAGLISTYAEGLDNVAIKAEFEALDATNDAHAIIDENADMDTRLSSQKEIIRRYQSSGEIPKDPKMQEILAKENLKKMGF